MQRSALLLGASAMVVESSGTNPMEQVLQLMGELSAKITKDGEAETKAFNEYAEWCDDTFKNTGFAIKTSEDAQGALEAKRGELEGIMSAAASQIEDLGAAIAKVEGELKDATTIRNKEEATFTASDAELAETIDTLGRAIGILSKEMAKNPASFAQMDTSQAAGAIQAFSAILEAATFPSRDQTRLAALIQAQQADQSDDLEPGAPAGAVYKSQSGGILDVMEDLKEKAEAQLSELRKAEVKNRHNFEMLKQSLEDQSAADTKDMEDEKASKSNAAEAKATAEGDLEVTVKELASSKAQLATAHESCAQVAADHEATVATRKEELAVIAQATKILQDTEKGAVSQTYSLLQLQSQSTGSEVVLAVRNLAKQQHSPALAQLASRISSVLRSHSRDPFAKVKGLIQDMLAKLEKQAGADATEKAYCDEQMSKTEAKKNELDEDIEKMTSKVDQSAARSAQLKEEIQVLEAELGTLAKEQAEMDKIRQEANADYKTAKADLDLGLSGVRQALDTLRKYYGNAASMIQNDAQFGAYLQQPAAPEVHAKAEGAGGSIINILEVVESDFATNLAKVEAEEADAASEYAKVTQENAVTKTAKDQAIKYKTKEAAGQEKTATEYTADREQASAELSALMEYYAKIKDRCIAKPEAYGARAARREAELAGLKEALSILESETALVQRKRRSFRGVM